MATSENEPKPLALYATGAQLERLCRGYRSALAANEAPSPEARSVRRRVLPGGMVKLEIVLCPDEAELVMRALERAREVEHEATQPNASAEMPDCSCEHSRVGSRPALGTCQPATLPPRASPSPSPAAARVGSRPHRGR